MKIQLSDHFTYKKLLRLTLPSMIMLRKAVKPRLLAVFIAVCTGGILAVGYLFNLLEPALLY